MENQIPSENSKKKYLPVLVLVAVILVGVAAYFMVGPVAINNKVVSPTATPQVTPTPAQSESPSASPSGSPSPTTVSAVKTFTVVGSSFAFSLKEIKVKKGDRVKIVFQNSGGMHDWVIDEFNTRTQKLQTGQSETVEFVADKVGTFQYYCSVGAHRANGMWGNLIVE